MQHSRTKTYIKRILGSVIFLGIFVYANVFLCLLLEFPETESEKMLTGYTKSENIDTIIVGNSITGMIDANQLSEETGYNVYNMGTPSQTFSISRMIVEMAAAQNPIKRVIFVTGYDSFEDEDIGTFEKIFVKTRNAPKSFWVRTYRQLRLQYHEATDPAKIKTTTSMIEWFPWIENSVKSASGIKMNFNRRVISYYQGHRVGDEYAFDLDKVFYERLPLNYTEEDEAFFEEDVKRLEDMDISSGFWDTDTLQRVDWICSYCRDNSIEMMYFISPHQSEYKARYNDNYDKLDLFLTDFFNRRNVYYHNFENDPEIHNKLLDEYFRDWEHIKNKYKKNATDVFSEKLLELK